MHSHTTYINLFMYVWHQTVSVNSGLIGLCLPLFISCQDNPSLWFCAYGTKILVRMCSMKFQLSMTVNLLGSSAWNTKLHSKEPGICCSTVTTYRRCKQYKAVALFGVSCVNKTLHKLRQLPLLTFYCVWT